MPVIPQRVLRNDVSQILRRAEAGETFTVTVNGREVAQLTPLPESRAERFADLLARTPVDVDWAQELHAQRAAELEP